MARMSIGMPIFCYRVYWHANLVAMTHDELTEAVEALRTLHSEVTDVEAKSAVGGLPRSVRAAVSAFANTSGGVVLLGIDESTGFSSVGVQDAGKMASDLSSMLADDFEPPIRALISQFEFEGHLVVAAEIPAVSYEQRPCFYKGAGMSTGSWTRTGAFESETHALRGSDNACVSRTASR